MKIRGVGVQDFIDIYEALDDLDRREFGMIVAMRTVLGKPFRRYHNRINYSTTANDEIFEIEAGDWKFAVTLGRSIQTGPERFVRRVMFSGDETVFARDLITLKMAAA